MQSFKQIERQTLTLCGYVSKYIVQQVANRNEDLKKNEECFALSRISLEKCRPW